MPSEIESLALYLVQVLFNSAGGLPHEWRMLEDLDRATTDPAARGLVAIQGSHSICLTDAGM